MKFSTSHCVAQRFCPFLVKVQPVPHVPAVQTRPHLLSTLMGPFSLQRLQSGTTGVCALIAGVTLHVAWLGDSQVILVQQGQVVKLMEPHRPERQVRGSLCPGPGYSQPPSCWTHRGTPAWEPQEVLILAPFKREGSPPDLSPKGSHVSPS